MVHKEDRFDGLVRKINELSGVYRNAAARSGLSVNEFWVWYTLMTERREFTQQEICGFCGLPKQTVNTIVRNMVRGKLATLEIIPLNRSRKRIRLTPAGRDFGEKLVAQAMTAERSAFLALPEEHQRAALTFLEAYLPLLRSRVDAEA